MGPTGGSVTIVEPGSMADKSVITTVEGSTILLSSIKVVSRPGILPGMMDGVLVDLGGEGALEPGPDLVADTPLILCGPSLKVIGRLLLEGFLLISSPPWALSDSFQVDILSERVDRATTQGL
jgi:hypothetical protein